VFKMKANALIDDLFQKHIFGRTVARIYTIEYQKRGLPHMHLIIFLHRDDKLSIPERVDQVI
ncbi:hypothetical protein CERSUDRAFT_41156, partial [Gelatoporia subvermispora B]